MFEKVDAFIRDINHRRIDLMRFLKLHLSCLIFPLFQKISVGEKKEGAILVLRLDDKIGDSIAATGFLAELKRHFPGNRLIVLSGPNSAFIYQQLAFVDEVLPVRKGLMNSFSVYDKLKTREFRFIFNTSHILSPQVLFLTCLLKAFRKFTFLNGNVRAFTDHVIYNKAIDHITVRYRKVFDLLGLSDVRLDYQLNLKPQPETEKADEIIRGVREGHQKIILLNSFSGARLRNLNQRTTTEIIRDLLKAEPDVCIISVGNRDDLAVVQKWKEPLRDPRWLCFPEGSSLAFNFRLAQQVNLIITPDTSWVHVASAFKRPVVAIYREDEHYEKNSFIWAPYKTKCRVIYAPFEPTRPFDINTISPQRVVKLAVELLHEGT